eukprot:3199631-Alexandrium_andersonii.AAC.1
MTRRALRRPARRISGWQLCAPVLSCVLVWTEAPRELRSPHQELDDMDADSEVPAKIKKQRRKARAAEEHK